MPFRFVVLPLPSFTIFTISLPSLPSFTISFTISFTTSPLLLRGPGHGQQRQARGGDLLPAVQRPTSLGEETQTRGEMSIFKKTKAQNKALEESWSVLGLGEGFCSVLLPIQS